MNHRTPTITLLLAALTLACGDDSSAECVAVDAQLGDPPTRIWCEGDYSPQMTWQGELATKALPVCLEPESSGECQLCPGEAVREAVGERLHTSLAVDKPECSIEHWELGCMRTVENAKAFGWETDYCCFQVAIWGPGCRDDTD